MSWRQNPDNINPWARINVDVKYTESDNSKMNNRMGQNIKNKAFVASSLILFVYQVVGFDSFSFQLNFINQSLRLR